MIDQWSHDKESRMKKYMFTSDVIIEISLLTTAIQDYSFERGMIVKVENGVVSFIEQIIE